MWLYIKGQADPLRVIEAVGKRADDFDGYWYNLDSGTVIFLTRDEDAFKRDSADRIRVWNMAAAEAHPVDVSAAFTGQEWPYTDKNLGDTTFAAVHKKVTAKLNELLDLHEGFLRA